MRKVLFELADKEVPTQAQVNLLRAELLRIGHDPQVINGYIKRLQERNR